MMHWQCWGGRGRLGNGWRAWPMLCLLSIVAALLGAAAGPASSDEELVKSGTITIDQVQLAWIGSGNLGGGKLEFGGQTYKFTVGGLGVGGFGVSKITATGEVYNLKNIAHFAGAYGQARYGVAVVNMSAGELFLENRNGVYIRLKAKREGLMLSLGADAIYIKID